MIGRVFLGRYETTRLLGEGGMGRVFLARQLDLPDRQVVVKVMHESVAADPEFQKRFRREIQLMGKFQHPYAVALYDFSVDDPLGPCIIMEYVRGVNLDQLLARNGRFTPARVGRLLNQLCEVLQTAHDLGIVHRDLKPANLMVVDADTPREKIKVMDFGIAKTLEPHRLQKVTDTNVDVAIGTPAYISPEQVRGGEIDYRSDLYSVGVLTYELLTGRLPFSGTNSMDMMLAHATEIPPRFAELGLDFTLSPEIESVVFRCLAKDPNERPLSAHEVADDFAFAIEQSQFIRNSLLTNLNDLRVDPPHPESVPTAPAPPEPPQLAGHIPPNDPHALYFALEAWMPESIALVKLEGFINDARGSVLESAPGHIAVRLPLPGGPEARRSWFSFRRKPSTVLLELIFRHVEGGRANQLHIDVIFRPETGHNPFDPHWRNGCTAQFVNLRSYLIGQTDS